MFLAPRLQCFMLACTSIYPKTSPTRDKLYGIIPCRTWKTKNRHVHIHSLVAYSNLSCLKAAKPPPISTLRSRKIGARKKLMDQGNRTPRAKNCVVVKVPVGVPQAQNPPVGFWMLDWFPTGPFGFWTPFGSYKFCQTTPTRVGGYIRTNPACRIWRWAWRIKPASQYMTRVTRVQGTAKSLAPHRTHDEMIFAPIFQHFLIIQWGVRSAKHLHRCWGAGGDLQSSPFFMDNPGASDLDKNHFLWVKNGHCRKAEWGVFQKIINHWCLKIWRYVFWFF